MLFTSLLGSQQFMNGHPQLNNQTPQYYRQNTRVPISSVMYEEQPITQSIQILGLFSQIDNIWDGLPLEPPSEQDPFNSSLIELLNHKKTLKKSITEMILNFSDLQLQQKNNHLLAYSQTYYRKGKQPFSYWIVQVEKLPTYLKDPSYNWLEPKLNTFCIM